MRPQVALPTLLVALLIAALAAVGCGGGSDQASKLSAPELLHRTFDSGAKVKSGHITVALDADVQGQTKPVALKLSGPFESAHSTRQLPRFDFKLEVTSSGATERYGATSTGDKGFLAFQGNEYAVPDELFSQFTQRYTSVQSQAGANKKATPSLKTLGIDPSRWLTDPHTAGEADVGDTSTVHVTAGIDVPKLLSDVQTLAGKAGALSGNAQQFSQSDRRALEKTVKSAKVDVYTGTDDQRLRKFVLDLQLTTGHVAFTLQYTDLDEPQDITAPKDAKPLSGLTGLLQGLGTQTPPPASGSANSRYLACVQKAAGDIAKVQACAKYL